MRHKGGVMIFEPARRHRWMRVSKMSTGRYEATPAAFKRPELYPSRCQHCGVLIDLGRRPSKTNADLTVELEIFSPDSGATWVEVRPACKDVFS